jgi:hypothetical protein
MLKYVYDANGNLVSQALDVGGTQPPQIVRQPVMQVVEPGQLATFSVVIADTNGISFQWRFNGGDIAGATGDTLLLTDVSAAANEGQYTVVATNSAGSATSAPAALMVDSDRDGLPDSWEIANFDNLTAQRGGGDPDNDGVSNADEFYDSTNPNSATSLRPRLTAYSDAGGALAAEPTKLSYDLGETVILTATPSAPNVLVGWAGDLTGIANPATLTMSGNKTVQARFATAAPLPPGAVAFWRGETDGSDLIGGHDGAFFSGDSVVAPSITPSGKVGAAFDFDGTVHVRVADSAALKLPQITVEAWVFPRVATPNDRQTIIACGSSTITTQTWLIGVQNEFPQFLLQGTQLDSPVTIPLNQWTHLATTFDGRIARFYVNGAQLAWQAHSSALTYDPVAPVTLGSDWVQGASQTRFTGRVDEVAVYARALTPDEVLGIYNADFLGKIADQPYFTSPSRLPDVAVGSSYAQQLTTLLGTAPISFSVADGILPPGITLSTAGLLSGVPGAEGTYACIARATDATGKFAEQLIVVRVPEPMPPPPDMVAWWRGEPTADGTVPDLIGGHGGGFFSGAVPAPPSYSADGEVGSAFAFDGTVYVQVPDAQDLRVLELTAEAWVFPLAQSGDRQTIVAQGSPGNTPTWALGLADGAPQFVAIGQHGTTLSSPTSVPLNRWTHLAMTFDGSIKSLYVNGAAVATSAPGQDPLEYGNPVPLAIGAQLAGSTAMFGLNGRVDEVGVYGRSLSAREVFSIFDAGPAGKSTAGPYVNSPSRLPLAILGQAYSHTFTSIRGTLPVSYALSAASALPPGLTLTSAGVLSGTPAFAGDARFVIRATDASGLFYEQPCSLRTFASVVAPAGLVGWWKAEGNAQDAIGGHDGTLRNGAGFAAGLVGQAFSLDGVDDFVEVSDAASLRPASLTLEAWVAFDAVFGPSVIFAKPVSSGALGLNHSFRLWLEQGTLTGAVGDAAALGPGAAVGFAPVPKRWYHLAFTFDDVSRQQLLYIDGVQVGVRSANKSIGYDDQALLLGGDRLDPATTAFFLPGRLDEASIYSRALTPLEIAAIVAAGPAGKKIA